MCPGSKNRDPETSYNRRDIPINSDESDDSDSSGLSIVFPSVIIITHVCELYHRPLYLTNHFDLFVHVMFRYPEITFRTYQNQYRFYCTFCLENNDEYSDKKTIPYHNTLDEIWVKRRILRANLQRIQIPTKGYRCYPILRNPKGQ